MKLETERLILRDFVKEDWQRVLEYQSDPLYLRYNDWTERTPEAVQEFVGWFLNQQGQEPRIKFQLAVVLKASNQLIGNCGVRMDAADSHEADIGYELDPKHWNHGYATEAARAIVDFGFSRLDVHRIWASCIAENSGSAHVLEKLGMHLEGRLREHKYFKGRWWDTLMYAILADEWEAHKQAIRFDGKNVRIRVMENFTTVKLEIFVPQDHALELRDELANIGVGVIGNYDHCMALTSVRGYFRPMEGSNPFEGEVGKISEVAEYKLEVNCRHELVNKAIKVIKNIHPYEEPLINVIPLANHLFG